MQFIIYTNLIYSISYDLLEEFLNTLSDIYKYLNMNIMSLYEPISLSVDSQKILYEIIYNIKKYRHQNYILDIIKHCLYIIKIQIKYNKLQIYNTECGKIIIMKDYLYDCSVNKYINLIYHKMIGESNGN